MIVIGQECTQEPENENNVPTKDNNKNGVCSLDFNNPTTRPIIDYKIRTISVKLAPTAKYKWKFYLVFEGREKTFE